MSHDFQRRFRGSVRSGRNYDLSSITSAASRNTGGGASNFTNLYVF